MAFIANFGHKNGVQTYKVNGTIHELTTLLVAMEIEGAKYLDDRIPKIEHVHRGEYTLLLELLIEEKGAAVNK